MTAPTPVEPNDHWESVYQRKPADSVSWYRPHLDTSLELLRHGGLSSASRVIDVGGGASTLVDDLRAAGATRLTVLDLSPQALALVRQRLGPAAAGVQWLAADLLTAVLPAAGFDLWHDRAVLHFLVDPKDAETYARQAAQAIAPGGQAVIGGFGPEGPERCSGLAVARRSPQDVAALMGPAFELVEERNEVHHTPGGAPQVFAWARLRRVGGG